MVGSAIRFTMFAWMSVEAQTWFFESAMTVKLKNGDLLLTQRAKGRKMHRLRFYNACLNFSSVFLMFLTVFDRTVF